MLLDRWPPPPPFRTNSFEKLIQHRFGSHVVQTLLTLGAKTIDREVRRA